MNQRITDGETIISDNQRFELGFFSPGTSKNRYLGIWYKTTPPHMVVWVANRETPVINTSGVVKLDSNGNLSLVNGSGSITWSSNSSASGTNGKPIAKLLNTGNFVIMNENLLNEDNYIWQSFDHPGDTYMPGMKLGKNFVTGSETYLTSWRSADDPSPAFAGQPNYKPDPVVLYKLDMVVNQNEMYYMYTSNSTRFWLRMVATPAGKLEVSQLNLRSQEWMQDINFPLDYCDNYGLCGPYGICSTSTNPNCVCLKGFELRNLQELNPYNGTSGCQRSRALDCGPEEGFLKFSSMKLPDTQNAVYNGNMNLQECEVACKRNCSCTAYANPNITAGGVGCLQWFGDLVDVRVYPQNGQDLYVRLAASELSDLRSSFHRKKRVVIEVSLSISIGLIFLGLVLALCTWSKRKKRSDVEREGKTVTILDRDHKGRSQKRSIDVPLFSLSKVSRATDNFSADNKLGEGGFGPVYKGVLEEGQEIAVKRLSKSSRQGLDEFENEVICIAKLQHRNLVKLLGYCIEGDETMLLYEYMPNKSLDNFIFDELRKSSLDWPQRFHIINGIARGLLYLHQDSRLKVVHRDLKAGNILLDQQMRPKISDFGLARMFKEHESEANTKRVVGTLGYISPEYAVNGLFSVKSDIFSFGVLVLEIVSGKKNRGFVHEKHHDHLLGHAWRLCKEGKSLDLIDECLGNSYSVPEVLRSVHVGLLCVQQRAEDRPCTPSVVAMLGGEGSLPSPKQPGFFIQGSEIYSASRLHSPSSVNGVTLTQIDDGETIVSRNERFELGFFSPGSSKNRYLGIWYKKTSPHTVIWVANRESPLTNNLGMVKLDSQGIMSLTGGDTVFWSSNSSASSTNVNPTAQLLDSGNMVINDGNGVIWQSFDYPGDTLVSGMKVGKNLLTGREKYLTSWRSADDPSPGEYTVRYTMNKGKYVQAYIRKNSAIDTRIGPYNGIEFAGQPNYKPNPVYVYKVDMVVNDEEMYFKLTYNSTTFSLRFIATPDGKLNIWHLNMRNEEWQQDLTLPLDNCDKYGLCGPYGSCSTVAYPNCGCLKGFELKNREELSPDNWTSGCRRSRPLDCGPGEGFLKFSSMKLPDTQTAVYNRNMSLQDCEVACKTNCSCNAYANPNITPGGVGCLLWFDDLIDTRVYPQNGQDLYVRLAASELLGRAVRVLDKDHNNGNKNGNVELPIFSLSRISKATNNFSVTNKLGEGGFGPVYKGLLEEGQEIAVKRLSKSSRQGLDEFENEVICIAKLQHRNLVKLLGYCIQGEETMLVYEYMPNKSLDWFIFDDLRKSLLDWPQRFHIINGIARGLLYLHQDSRLRVVHRDLKAGNVLLDQDMNPKISDFGLARMFKGHESEANTKRVVGTLGYISPEYAANGLFSIKSDIFSFGVLVLEIVSGKKNGSFAHENHHESLIGHAWRLYKEGKPLDLIDASLEDRPATPFVVSMLGGESSLPNPKQPGFFIPHSENDSTSTRPSSLNDVTLSQIEDNATLLHG
nr:G-type lectin S-receptor-like serine/threonine-protein kinase [Tanacetum cinerariifolium]